MGHAYSIEHPGAVTARDIVTAPGCSSNLLSDRHQVICTHGNESWSSLCLQISWQLLMLRNQQAHTWRIGCDFSSKFLKIRIVLIKFHWSEYIFRNYWLGKVAFFVHQFIILRLPKPRQHWKRYWQVCIYTSETHHDDVIKIETIST